jgi:hypothetical protein
MISDRGEGVQVKQDRRLNQSPDRKGGRGKKALAWMERGGIGEGEYWIRMWIV